MTRLSVRLMKSSSIPQTPRPIFFADIDAHTICHYRGRSQDDLGEAPDTYVNRASLVNVKCLYRVFHHSGVNERVVKAFEQDGQLRVWRRIPVLYRLLHNANASVSCVITAEVHEAAYLAC